MVAMHTLAYTEEGFDAIEREYYEIEDFVGQRIKTHWHFNAKMFSVAYEAGGGRWYVCRYREDASQQFAGKLVLTDVEFKVNPGGARKAYETGKRNVHASVIGTLQRFSLDREDVRVPCGVQVVYSHNLYPEPEFKANIFGYEGSFFDKPINEWPGITHADMAALGVIPNIARPNMLVAGELTLKGV